MAEKKKYSEGHFVGMWIGIGIAIFTGVGVPLSFATGNPGLLGLGPAIGVAFGVAIGSGIEAKHKEEGRMIPLTKAEKNSRKKAVAVGVAALLVGVVAFVLMLFL